MAEINYTHRPSAPEESLYMFRQSHLMDACSGCLGHLRGDFGKSGTEFWSDWWPRTGVILSPAFKEELDQVVNSLRESADFAPLKDLSTMRVHCRDAAKLDDELDSYGFRVDTNHHTYLLRCLTQTGNQNFYLYCFDRNTLEQHLENSRRGIRFVDIKGNELFRLPDGGYSIAHYPKGMAAVHHYRYFDETHVEDNGMLLPILELAKRNEQDGITLQPAQLAKHPESPQKAKTELIR